MDFEEEFRAATKEAIQACRRRGKETRSWKADGKEVTGWTIDSDSWGPEVEGTPGQGWWRERWGHTTYILSDRGEIWCERFDGEDSSSAASYTGTTLSLVPDRSLVGAKGKPYSEWKAKIERVPYL